MSRAAVLLLVSGVTLQAHAASEPVLFVHVQAAADQRVDLNLEGALRAKAWSARGVGADATRKGHALMPRSWWVGGGEYRLVATLPGGATCEAVFNAAATEDLFDVTVTVHEGRCTTAVKQLQASAVSRARTTLTVVVGGRAGQRVGFRIEDPAGVERWSGQSAPLPDGGVLELPVENWFTGPGRYRLTATPPAPQRPCELSVELDPVPVAVHVEVRPTPEGCAMSDVVEPVGRRARGIGDFPPHAPQKPR